MIYKKKRRSILSILLIVALSLFIVSCKKDLSHSIDSEIINNTTYTIRFYTEFGVFIDQKECKFGEALIPPTPPRIIGHVFRGWDKDILNVTGDTDITALYTCVSEDSNVIVAENVYATTTDAFEVLIGIYGDVEFCGLDMDIIYDNHCLELIQVNDVDESVIFNSSEDNIIHMNYVSTNNTTGDVDFMSLKFKSLVKDSIETCIQIEMKSFYRLDDDNQLITADYYLVDNKIIIGGVR